MSIQHGNHLLWHGMGCLSLELPIGSILEQIILPRLMMWERSELLYLGELSHHTQISHQAKLVRWVFWGDVLLLRFSQSLCEEESLALITIDKLNAVLCGSGTCLYSCTLKAEVGKSLSPRSAWSIEWGAGQVKATQRNPTPNKKTKHNLKINKTEVQEPELKWSIKLRAHRLLGTG